MWRIILLASAFALLVPSLALAQIVELEGRYWFSDIKGKVQIDSRTVEGTRIDFNDDLGIDAENAPGFRLTFNLPLNHKIRLAYTHMFSEGDTTLERTVTFAGATFNASTRVVSELEIHYGQLGWIWQPIAIPGLLKVGPMIELKGIQLDASIETRDANPAIREDKNLGVVLPTIGAALDITPHRLIHLFAEASGIPAGTLGYLIDAEAGIRFIPWTFFSIVAGYRFFEVRVEHDDDFGEARLNGPFVGLSVRF